MSVSKYSYKDRKKTINVTITCNVPSDAALKKYANTIKEILIIGNEKEEV